MSRIGKKPIPVPQGVDVSVSGRSVTVKGKHGQHTWSVHSSIQVSYDASARILSVARPNDEPESRALHGLTRALLNNMVTGVVQPFEKRLEIQGVGYNAALEKNTLVLNVGFANSVRLTLPGNVTCELPDTTHIVVKSIDRGAAGQFAADVRAVRPPEPYNGKGIRYQDEYVRRKAGKAFAGGGG